LRQDIRRGIIILEGGTWLAVPEPVLDEEEITWPLGLPEKEAGHSPKYFAADDFYRRHELVPGKFYVFAKDSTLRLLVP
jgi:hypothetical protein